MKILLDENLLRKLVAALSAEGHEVESVHTFRLQGMENGTRYEFASNGFDLCFAVTVALQTMCDKALVRLG